MSEENPPSPRALAPRTASAVSDFDRVFEALWNRAPAAYGVLPFESTAFVPWTDSGSEFRLAPTDVVDTGTAFLIKAEVPGIAKDQIDVRVKGTLIEISGGGRTDKTDSSRDYVHRERRETGFHRSFELPEPVVAEKAKAHVVNGVLELELPKQTPTPDPAETKVKVD